MDNFTPTFKGELQFRRYSDTSTQGQQVVFAVADREALECFIGKEGKRFAAMLVELGEDEQPVSANPLIPKNSCTKPELKREPLGDLCWRAVQWCREPEFAYFIGPVYYREFPGGLPGTPVIPTDGPMEVFTKFAVQKLCGVESRKELDTNPEAARKFNQLIRGPYQKHLIARGIVR
nr:hypothetical protein [Comamonas thiooxydans]